MRRLSLGLVVAVSVVSVTPVGHAADAPAAPPVPRAGCATFTDATNDAVLFATPNDPDLDITNVVWASPPGLLRAYIQVAKLGSPTYAVGHKFTATLQLAGKPLDLSAGEDTVVVDDVHSAVSSSGAFAPLTRVSYDGAPVPNATIDVVWDTVTNTVILTTSRAPIETMTKQTLADGTTLEGASATSYGDLVYTAATMDTATGAAKSPYTIGDNHCFEPPAGKLALTVPTSVVSGHTALVSGVLTTEAGAAMAGKSVKVSLAGKSASVTSGADGKFSTTFTLTSTAGSYPATATFAGDDTLKAVTATAPVTVKIQPTTTTLTSSVSGTTATVKAQVLDDLRKPVAGQTVTWLVNGKAAGTSKTDSSGRATLRTTKGATVKGTFGGVKNRYASSYGTRKV